MEKHVTKPVPKEDMGKLSFVHRAQKAFWRWLQIQTQCKERSMNFITIKEEVTWQTTAI